MHRFILEQLAAAHVKDQLAAVDDARRARQARRARSQASRQGVLSLPGMQAILLIRVARALRAVHQELEIASECLLRPGPAPQADPLTWVRTHSGYCLAGRYLPDLARH